MSKLVSIIGLVFFIGQVSAEVPETIIIDNLNGKKGAVEFVHKKHTSFKKEDGIVIVCKDCHHTFKDNEPVQSCKTCHLSSGKPKVEDDRIVPLLGKEKVEGEFELSSILYHENCLLCHKKVSVKSEKKISSCNTCHPKK